MHNQHAGLSHLLAAQRLTERQEQATQARLAHSAGRPRRRRRQWAARRWWQLARWPGTTTQPAVVIHTASADRSGGNHVQTHRTLIIAATLAAMHLAGMTAVAHAQATDQPTGRQATLRPPTERQVGEPWRHHQAASPQQTAADAALKRVQARERFSIPNATAADVPAPVPPKPSGQPGRLIVWLGGLVAALVLAGGLVVLAARRTRHRARLEHAA